MRVIWKYIGEAPLDMAVTIDMAIGSIVHSEVEPLTKNSRQRITLWVDVPDENNPLTRTRSFLVVGTGHGIPVHAQHLKTIFDSPFVWHLLEVTS